MNAAYDQLIQLLDERDVGYLANEDDQSICAELTGDVGVYRVIAQVIDDAELFQIYGLVPILVPSGCRPAIAEAVIRANYGLRVGKFELDVDSGQVRFHASQVILYDAVGEEVIDRLISTTMALLDQYVPAFLSVIFGNEDPKDAIACAEAGYFAGDQEERS